MTAITRQAPASPVPALGRILAVTEHSAAGAEAVRQAALLAGPGQRLEIICIAPERSPGAPRPQAHQIEALVAARLIAHDVGVHPETHIVEAVDDAGGVLDRCVGHDLVVLPASAAEVVARSPIPALVARPAPAGSHFTDSILIAVDGSTEAHEAARAGAALAARFGSLVALVATPEHDAAHRHALQDDVAAVAAITGATPLVLDEQRAVEPSILGAAATAGATLIVLGSRVGKPEHSVSAAIARDADRSVLVLRGQPTARSAGVSR